jgi:hypothetical protein
MACETFIARNFSPETLRIIERSQSIVTQYAAQGYDLSVRQLYYQHVARGWLDNNERNYKRLGSIINDARLAGLIDWGRIKDRNRQTLINAHWSSPQSILRSAAASFALDKWATQHTHVEVMVEKAALEGVLVPVCQALDVPFTANRGYSSVSAFYETATRMRASVAAGKQVVVLYLGDHDPSGIDMTRDVDDRLGLFLGKYWYEGTTRWIDPEHADDIRVERLALNMDQVAQYDPPPNPAKMTDSRANGYVAQYGGSSWELDALDPAVLGDLVRDAVLDLRDEDAWDEIVERERGMIADLQHMADTYQSP